MTGSVAVIGSGMMGSAIAAMSALAGNRTLMVDLNMEKALNGRKNALECIKMRADNGLNTQEEAVLAADNLICCGSLKKEAENIGLVIEAIVEQLPAKQNLFEELDKLLLPTVPICSNTSGLRITDISAKCMYPERTITTHFWLPGHLAPLVELVMGEKTREDIALCVRDELTHWKKVPVLVKRDVPGQLANRIFQAIIRESIDIVASGLAGAEDVDAAISYGMAMRFPEWGPLKHLDAIGLDLGISVQDTVLPDICAVRHSNTYLKNLVDEGKLGVKSKQGFYDWKVRDIEKEIRKRDQFIIETVKLVTRLDKE